MNKQHFLNICASLPPASIIRGMSEFNVSLAEMKAVLPESTYHTLETALYQEDDNAWGVVISNGTNDGLEQLSSLRQYIDTYPKGRHIEDAQNRLSELEQTMWEAARKKDTEAAREKDITAAMLKDIADAYYAFIAEFPDSQHCVEARNRADEAEWKRLSREGKFDEYLNAFPNGRYEEEANEAKKDPEWFKVTHLPEESRLPQLRKYIEEHPYSPHQQEANVMIEQMTDDKDWETAKKGGTPNAYEDYLAKHPNGKHVNDARTRIDEWSGVTDYLAELKRNPNYDTAVAIQRKLSNGEFKLEMLSEAIGQREAVAIQHFTHMSKLSPDILTSPGDSLQEHATEVYFWGTKGTGKTCAMGALLSGAETLEPFLMQQEGCRSGYYMTQLKQIFKPNEYTPLPPGNASGAIEEMVMKLNDDKGRKHRITFIDIAGELVQSFYNESNEIVVSQEIKQAKKKLTAYLNNPVNRKIHFFIVEYNSHNKLIDGVQVSSYLAAMSTFLDENIKVRTNGVYLLVTKSDIMEQFDALSPEQRAENAQSYVKDYFNNFYTNMQNLCHKAGIKNFRTVYFTIGKVIGQQLCMFDSTETRKILNEILLKSPIEPTTLWEKFIAWLNDD